MVTFTWRSLKDDWGIATTHIFYQKHKIENFETSSDANVKTLKFKISDFERHPFEKQFRIRIKYAFFDELTITYETEYLFDVSES